nr:nitroreductase family protein [Kibdelosporangium sp. MJ126-NF4]CEL20699.1 Nitroreductase family protein [Kibdelosporangium sp. MJ126-NF4]CTQ89612.1 Nitroreductase family protein [Kibdelosporangium sp. MJ126-NF4]
MEFSEVIRRRRMVRHFTGQPLAPEVVEKILASALRAPSAGFSQGWAFLSLTDPEDRARFWPYAPSVPEEWPTTRDVPLIVVPLAHKQAYLDRYAQSDKGWEDRAEARWPAPYWYIDTGMASLMMLLSAVDEGLGALFFGIEPQYLDGVKKEFGIPDTYAPLGAILIGHRAEGAPVIGSAATRARRGTGEVIHHGQWGKSG